MKSLGFLPFFLVLFLLASCRSESSLPDADYDTTPLAQEVQVREGAPFVMDAHTVIYYPEGQSELLKEATFLKEYVREMSGLSLRISTEDKQKEQPQTIVCALGLEHSDKEAYELMVSESQIKITGASEAGLFYGIQRLRKSLPVGKGAVALPQVLIKDHPRFAYRGMMLDVARHFTGVDSIKRFIDILALHQINRMHWHLTDDQGWRLEIKGYPKLTEIASKRKETVIGRNTDKYDGKPYGGYYTQKEVKDIIAYAQDRHITVIPEIDLPGHMLAALAAYPELGCTGGPYEVGTRWGVFEDVLCPGTPQTLTFITEVLSEVAALFPSEYIHIGGDEVPKVRWKKCPKCQTKMRELGIKSDKQHTAEERLQSFVIRYAGDYLKKQGKKIIGWDEILEGGLAPGATVMSWRGIEGGIAAAKQHNRAIMSPYSHMYFDYYQYSDSVEPLAIGGHLPVQRVYAYEPIPKQLADSAHKYIMGVQANLWAEYIPSFRHAEYMLLPRMAALSEVGWSGADKKDYEGFLKRLLPLFAIYRQQGYNYAPHLYHIRQSITPNFKERTLNVRLSTIDDAPIYYTLDGSVPDARASKYTHPLQVDRSLQLRAVALRKEGKGALFSDTFNFNKASLKPIEILTSINESYKYGGATVLVDALQGGKDFRSGRWIGFQGNDLEAIIDLEALTEISEIAVRANIATGSWIFDARGCTVWVSEDRKHFKQVASEAYPAMPEGHVQAIRMHTLSFDPVRARYVKIKVKSERRMPKWFKEAKGNNAYLFVDEIMIH